MTGDASTGARLLGTLGTADGKGVVRVEDRFDADRVWPAGGARLRETCDWAASIASGFCQRMGRHREGGSLRGPAAAAGAAQGTGPV